jgi:hypothetical protein
MVRINEKKYLNAVLYLCAQLGGEVRGKKKLAKLLYFADFDFYEKNQRSITGDIYKAFPKGPLPDALNEIIDTLSKKKLLAIESVKEWGEEYAPTEVYRCLAEPDETVFEHDEKRMIDKILKRYGDLNG